MAKVIFFINIIKSKAYNTGYQIKLRFTVSQHIHDTQLMKHLMVYLECGKYYVSEGYDFGDFVVTRFEDIYEKIIPFFKKYPIEGVKALDFSDFCEAAELMKNKEHLTQEGLEKIKNIKARMNRNRTFNNKFSQ